MSENGFSSYQPGEEFKLKVYIQNNTGEVLKGGVLNWSGSSLEEAGFPMYGDWMEEVDFENLTDEEKEELLEDMGKRRATASDAERGLPGTDEEQSDGKRIWNIEIHPGEVYEAEFSGIVNSGLKRVRNRELKFSFSADKESGESVREIQEFTYNTGIASMLPVEFENGNRLEPGEENIMYLRTAFTEEELASEVSGPSFDTATGSRASRATGSGASRATASDAEDEGVGPGDLKYSIQTYGVKLKDISAEYDAEASGQGQAVTRVSFRVEENAKPGLYFGTVETAVRYNRKSYQTEEGFFFYVTEEGEVVLRGRLGEAEIQVKGPAESFPEGELLSLKVSEVPEEKQEMVQAAMEQKAEESGISINRMKAVDIKVVSDGEEAEPSGQVKVTFGNLQLENVEEKTETATETENETEEAVAEEYAEAPRMFSARRMARAVQSLEVTEENTEAETEAETGGENSQEEKGIEEESLAVWHLNEDTGVLDDMESTVDDNGNVVMTTDHFSIYIVVDMEQLGGNITLTVEHWGQNIKTINANGTTDPYFIMLDTSTKNSDSGKRYGYHTKDEVYDRHTKQIVKIDYNEQLYTPDTIMLPNRRYESIEELSKVCLVTAKKEYAEKNYELGEIWISSNLSNQGKNTWAEWASPKTKITVTRDGNGNITNTEGVTLKANSVIRFVYKEKEVASYYYQPVTFYDYNVTDGGQGETTTAIPGGSNQGTNKSSNFTGGSNKMGVGQESSGNKSTPWNNAHTDVSGLKGYLNKGNNAKDNSEGIFYDDNVPNKTNGKANSLISAVVRNEVQENLTADYKLQFHPHISQPGFFEENSGTKKFTNYKLGFQQTGDTYILSTVQRNSSTVLSDLETIKYSAHNGTNDSNIYSNNFWPLDKEHYNGADSQVIDGSDGGGTHNWHFGMHYAFTFSVGDYTGPMNFYFRGDDDFWLFVDGKRAIDLGGIHFAVGQAINMRQWLEEHGGVEGEHRIDIYYMERGGFGSCCYMQFTLPNCIPVDSPKNPQTQVTVKKKWNDYNNPNRPSDIDITLWQMHNEIRVDKGTVTLSEANNWQHTWTELPVSDPNDVTLKYTYEVIEKNVPPGYDSQTIHTTGSDANGWIITLENKLDPEVKVKVTKQWEDNDNKCSNRPDQLQFQLYADGKALAGKILTLDQSDQVENEDQVENKDQVENEDQVENKDQVENNSNVWSGEFEHLPKYRYETNENGDFIKNPDGTYKAVEIVYTVKEVDEEGNMIAEGGGLFGKNEGVYTVSYENLSLPEDHLFKKVEKQLEEKIRKFDINVDVDVELSDTKLEGILNPILPFLEEKESLSDEEKERINSLFHVIREKAEEVKIANENREETIQSSLKTIFNLIRKEVRQKSLKLTEIESNNDYVAHTIITNAHKHNIKVKKVWSDGSDAFPYVGLYQISESDNSEKVEIVKRMYRSDDGEIIAEFDNLNPSEYKVKELQECKESDEPDCSIVSLKAEKLWTAEENRMEPTEQELPYVGVYDGENPVKGKIQRMSYSAGEKKFVTEFIWLNKAMTDEDNSYTNLIVKELEELQQNNEKTSEAFEERKAAADFVITTGGETKYYVAKKDNTIDSSLEKNKFFKGINDGGTYETYYEVKYETVTVSPNVSPNFCIQEITITNTKKTARFRVAKKIDNYEDDLGLEDDRFIIKVENTDTGFYTGLVLEHAGITDDEIKQQTDRHKISGYIEVPVTDEGVTYQITETVPKEYTAEEGAGYLSVICIEKRKVEQEIKKNDDTVTIYPGDDLIIVVHNKFNHKDYFHGDNNVENNFSAGIPKKGTTRTLKAEPEPVDLFGLIPAHVLASERDKEKHRKLDEDDRLM